MAATLSRPLYGYDLEGRLAVRADLRSFSSSSVESTTPLASTSTRWGGVVAATRPVPGGC